MPTVVAALIGVVWTWLTLAVLALLIWMGTDHPRALGILLVTVFGAVIGFEVHYGAMC